MTLTASKVELAATCAASMVLPQTQEIHVGQDDGNDRHAALETDITAGNVPDVLAQRWSGYTWRSEIAFSIDLATGEAKEVGERIGRAYPEAGPFTVFGTADLVGRGPAGELVICDRKSFDPNISRSHVNGQLHTLALLACKAYDVLGCEVAIWHELRALDVSTVEPWDLKTYNDELFALIESTTRARAEYRKTGVVSATPGKHCRWCAAFHSCPAQNALVTQVRSGVIGTRVEAMIPLERDEDAAKAYEFLGDLKMLVARLNTALHARAAERPIPLGNGKLYGPRAVKGNRQIDGDKAYELLRELHGPKVADASVTRETSQTQIRTALKAGGIPHPDLVLKDLVKQLEKTGGVTRKDSTRIEEYDAPALLAEVANG